MKIKLGQKLRDTISGFEGIAICRTEWLNGCFRVSLQGRVDKDGKLPESYTFDEPQLEIIANTPRENPNQLSGGPIPSPQRAKDPTR